MTDYVQAIVQAKKTVNLPDLSDAELSFIVTRPIKLNLAEKHSDLLEYLLYQIVRNPKNLIAHIQRIFFCYRENLHSHLTAALIDLMIALGSRGERLKRRMLIGVKTKLDEEQWRLVQDASQLKNPLPIVPFALLAPGTLGHTQLVTQNANTSLNEPDSLTLARDYINYSQLDEAKTVLESAILEDIESEALQHELLGLYYSTQDVAGYRRMVDLLDKLGNPHQQIWNDIPFVFPGIDA